MKITARDIIVLGLLSRKKRVKNILDKLIVKQDPLYSKKKIIEVIFNKRYI